MGGSSKPKAPTPPPPPPPPPPPVPPQIDKTEQVGEEVSNKDRQRRIVSSRRQSNTGASEKAKRNLLG